MTPSPQSPGLFNWILLLGLGVIWGAAFMSVAVALEGFGPITVAALRVTLGAAGLWAIAVAMGQPLKTIPANGRFHVIYVGVAATALPFMLLSWGITHVPSAFAGIAMGALPILMVPLVWGKLPATILTSVDLPAPLSPIRPTASPGPMLRSIPCSA